MAIFKKHDARPLRTSLREVREKKLGTPKLAALIQKHDWHRAAMARGTVRLTISKAVCKR